MTPDRILAAIDGTWPPARIFDQGGWTFRQGQGGGQRVSATTLARPPVTADKPAAGGDGLSPGDMDAAIARAEAGMLDMGQHPLFMIRPGETLLDAALDRRGYLVHDPVRAWACPPAQLCDRDIPRVTVFDLWEPLAIQREIWAAGGIGPGRLAVMARTAGPRTALLGRWQDKPAAVAFVAIHDGVAMLHALEVRPEQRRKGMAGWMMRGAAAWARDNGADCLAVLCTLANGPANGLYAALGMASVTEYHYRRRPDASGP